MIRRLVNWLLQLIGRKKPEKSAIETLMSLVPLLLVAAVLWTLTPRVRRPWYIRYWFRARGYIRYCRTVLIGY